MMDSWTCGLCGDESDTLYEDVCGLVCEDCHQFGITADQELEKVGIEGMRLESCDGQSLSGHEVDALFAAMIEMSHAALADDGIAAAEAWRDAAKMLMEAQYREFLRENNKTE